MQLVQAIAASTLLTLLLLLTAIFLEHVGPLERLSLRARVPGFLMSAVGTPLLLLIAWQLNKLWSMTGVGAMLVIPLWRWLEPYGTIGYIVQVGAVIVLSDFLVYWKHRAEHTWFWRIHVVHHSPRELHAANDIAHPLQAVYTFALITVPLSLVQIDGPETPFVVGGVVLLASMYIHSPVQWHLGLLRRVLVDNRFHRIHHSLEERHFDKNFGILLSVWDRLFGTAYEPGEEWPAVGVAGVKPPSSVLDYLMLPFAGVAPLSDRLPSPSEASATCRSSQP
jgi:sterol desaturase/sphingolipid hydroxylase (fatty acid hydroxylase superfamily)